MALPEPPFGPQSLTGFELELLARRGSSRRELAVALARRIGGRVRFGLKHNFLTVDEETGQVVPCCEMTPSCEVVDARGRLWVSLVDDFSIRKGLHRRAPPHAFPWRLVLDDVRIAVWAERNMKGADLHLERRLRPLLRTFSATLGGLGEGERCAPTHRLVIDREGNVLAVVAPYGEERDRVTEVVTRPLRRSEREKTLTLIFDTALALGFELPPQGSIHAHLDAAPWRDTARLKRLLLDYNGHRARLHQKVQPNPNSEMWRGEFDERMVEVAARASAQTPFPRFALALLGADPVKNRDLNILGVVRQRHRQPTLEVRFLPLDPDASRTLERLGEIEGLLSQLAAWADGERRGPSRRRLPPFQ